MNMRKPITICLLLLLGLSNQLVAQKHPLRQILKSQPDWDTLLANKDRYQIQIIYTQINRNAKNVPSFESYTFGLDTNLYFYPASTVKMPAAFLALEKINKLKVENLTKFSTMRTGVGKAPQTAAETDSSAANGLPSLAQYIKKIFLVSDNDAFNRLYEFLGQEYINKQLWEKGYHRSRIVHRLAVPGYDVESNKYTNPVAFYDDQGNEVYRQGQVHSQAYPKLNLRKQVRGIGYMDDSTFVAKPFDFLNKNYIGLEELHDILKAVMFPQSVRPEQRFDLTEEDYQFLYRYMSMLPKESDHPRYSKDEYWDSYVKFLMFGDKKDSIPSNIAIFNKVGDAYGFLTDVAYIVDFNTGVEFILAATIHVNNDEIYNDNKYEYEKIGFPFLGRLGRLVYNYELKRERVYPYQKPDLSRFMVHQSSDEGGEKTGMKK